MTGPLATTTFDTVAVVLGGMLVAGALVAGLARRSFLSLTALFVFGGFVLGHGVLDVLSFDPVCNRRVRRIVRHSLHLASGLSDGLALPAVLALAAALDARGGHFTWWRFVLEDLSIGLASGVVVGFAAARLLPLRRALGAEVTAHQKSMYALGAAFVAYGVAVLPPRGNGLIATFVAAIVLGIMRPDVRG